MSSNLKKWPIKMIGYFLVSFFIILTLRHFQPQELQLGGKNFYFDNKVLLLGITVAYMFSFLLRALAWKYYLNKPVKFIYCLGGILFSLVVNHIAPFKIGDVVRIGFLAKKEKHLTLDEAVHSVLVLRLLDMLTLISFSFVGLLVFSQKIKLNIPVWLFVLCLLLSPLFLFFLLKWKPFFLEKHLALLKKAIWSRKFFIIYPLIFSSWVLEGTVVWGVTSTSDLSLSFIEAIWVNSITVGGQVFQITPGGITTYESIMTISLAVFHYPVASAYNVAIISHSFKFIFSYVIGILLLLKAPLQTIKLVKELLYLRGDRRK